MSLSAVKPLFQDLLEAQGFEVWRDGFDINNIPSTIIDNSAHVELGSAVSAAANQTIHGFEQAVTVRLFKKAFANVSSGIDEIILEGENVLSAVLAPSFRLGSSVRDISPEVFEVTEYTLENNNLLVLTINFNTKIYCNF